MSEAKQMITEDQLKKIQDFQKELNKLLNETGFLEAQKPRYWLSSMKLIRKLKNLKRNLKKSMDLSILI